MKRNKSKTTPIHKHEQQTIKVKHKSKGREMQPQDNAKMCYQRVREERCNHKIMPRCVIKEETEKPGKKPLRDPPSQNQSTRE